MKVKTITCHNVYNVGASLQAYALMRFIESLGHEVEIINYMPDYLNVHYRLFYVDNPNYRKNIIKKLIYSILKFPKKLKGQKRKKIFKKFNKKYLNIGRLYKNYNELEENPPIADMFIVGSDQVWNPKVDNGKDRAFFLDFVPNNIPKISYAASFAVNKMPNSNVDFVKKMLCKFSEISVRESTGLKILNQLGIHDGKEVLDPVFLLSKNEWDKMAGDNRLIKEKYILVYDFDKSQVIRNIAIQIKKDESLKIVSVFKNSYADINYINTGPIEFLNLIKFADIVITNSFHATAFSIIFNKKFYVVGRNEGVNSRMIDLLNKLGLKSQYIFNEILDKSEINYTGVNEKLSLNINDSQMFLKTSLNMLGKKNDY